MLSVVNLSILTLTTSKMQITSLHFFTHPVKNNRSSKFINFKPYDFKNANNQLTFFYSPCTKTIKQVKFTILWRLLVRFPPGLTGLEFLGEWIGEECILLPRSLDEGPILNKL